MEYCGIADQATRNKQHAAVHDYVLDCAVLYGAMWNCGTREMQQSARSCACSRAGLWKNGIMWNKQHSCACSRAVYSQEHLRGSLGTRVTPQELKAMLAEMGAHPKSQVWGLCV